MRADETTADTMEEASKPLLERALDPRHWGMPSRTRLRENRCVVGRVEVCASVDVTPTLETFIRVSFRGPGLSPMRAAELLEEFTGKRFPSTPNVEWFVEIDGRQWIHFSRRYTRGTLLG